MKTLFLLFLILFTGCADPSKSFLAQIDPPPGLASFEFDPNAESDLAGYKIHWGESSRDYIYHKDLGKITHITVTDLLPGIGYFFAVTAYDTAGLESEYSDEVSFSVPIEGVTWATTEESPLIDHQTFEFQNSTFFTHFQFTGHGNTKYLLQAKTDLSASTWKEVDQFNVRGAEDKDIFCTYSFNPVPTGVFYSVVSLH